MISLGISVFGFAQLTTTYNCKLGVTTAVFTAQKMKLFIKDFSSKCYQIPRKTSFLCSDGGNYFSVKPANALIFSTFYCK